MRRRRTTTPKPAKTQHGSTTKPKRDNAPTAAGGRGPSVAALVKQLDMRTRKLAEMQSKLDQQSRVLGEALDQQKATSEVLRVISNSPIDLQSALGAIAEAKADAWRGRVQFAALRRKAVEPYERRHQPSLRSPSLAVGRPPRSRWLSLFSGSQPSCGMLQLSESYP